MQIRRRPGYEGPKHEWFDRGQLRPVMEIALELSDEVRIGLGWLLFHPAGMVVRVDPETRAHRVAHAERGWLSPEIPPSNLRGLLLIKLLMPRPENHDEAVGNPDFLRENRAWLSYIPDPKRMRRR